MAKTAGNPISSTLCAAILAAILLTLGACEDPAGNDPDTPPIDFDRQAMLTNLGENVLLPVYRDFDGSVATLQASVGDYCAAIESADESARLSDARDAWRATMGHWQLAEMMLFGPAAMDGNTLRDRIYSWPVISSCAVDQDIMAMYQSPDTYDISTRLTNRRGLDALEYVLFTPDLDTTCPPQIEPDGWTDLDQLTRKNARCAYAQQAAADLGVQSSAILTAWEPEQGDYLGDLANAGGPGSSFASAQEAVNVVSDALFYIDGEVKDMKLGEPAGIVVNICSAIQEPCTDELESQFARHSKQNVAANLVAFDMIFRGYGPEQSPDDTGTIGFDDFLVAAGGDALATTMIADTLAAAEATAIISDPLSTALTDDYQSVVDAHTAVKAITDNLKSQFLTVLGLDLPDSAAGDND